MPFSLPLPAAWKITFDAQRPTRFTSRSTTKLAYVPSSIAIVSPSPAMESAAGSVNPPASTTSLALAGGKGALQSSIGLQSRLPMVARSTVLQVCSGTIARKPHASSGAASKPSGTAAGPTATQLVLPARAIWPVAQVGRATWSGVVPGSFAVGVVVGPPAPPSPPQAPPAVGGEDEREGGEGSRATRSEREHRPGVARISRLAR